MSTSESKDALFGEAEKWIDKESTLVVNSLIDIMRNDHESEDEERTHDDSQEDFEACVASALRRAISFGILHRDPAAIIVSPATASPSSETMDVSLGYIRDLMFVINSKAPEQAREELLKKASDFYWKTKRPDHG